MSDVPKDYVVSRVRLWTWDLVLPVVKRKVSTSSDRDGPGNFPSWDSTTDALCRDRNVYSPETRGEVVVRPPSRVRQSSRETNRARLTLKVVSYGW